METRLHPVGIEDWRFQLGHSTSSGSLLPTQASTAVSRTFALAHEERLLHVADHLIVFNF